METGKSTAVEQGTGKPTPVKNGSIEQEWLGTKLGKVIDIFFMDGSFLKGDLLGVGKYTLLLGTSKTDRSLIYKHAIKRIEL